MHSKTEQIDFITYFNEILINFYEDENDVKKLGKSLGFDVENNYFVAVSFLYPSNVRTSFEDKGELRDIVAKIDQVPAINKKIAEQQFLFIEKGVVTFLIGENKHELIEALVPFKEQALAVLKEANLKERVRIGVGLIEKNVKGIKRTFRNSVDAIHAGEIFKKERDVLEYMSMEIYGSINAMVSNYGDRITSVVLKQLDDQQQRVLAKYYKCKEDTALTAESLSLTQEEVEKALFDVKLNTGLDVHDTEDNFKLQLVMVAKKVLGAKAEIDKMKKIMK